MATPLAQYRAFVIGTGNIGAFLDAPGSESILSHCHAYKRNPRTLLSGLYDLDNGRAQKAAEIWGSTAFKDLQEGLATSRPDIISICTPPHDRLKLLKTIFSACKPRYLFLEKPVASSADELKIISALLKNENCGVQVNFLRHFDPTMIELKRKIQAGELGNLQQGAYFYGKGFKNNGSHLIQLLAFLMGVPRNYTVIDGIEDGRPDDHTLEVRLKWPSGGSFTLLPVHESRYSTIEGILYFDKARVHLKQFGIQWSLSSVREDPVFPGYRDLDETQGFQKTGLLEAFPLAIETLVRELDEACSNPVEWMRILEVESLMHQIYESRRL
jgi:predicted dehydrogenase